MRICLYRHRERYSLMIVFKKSIGNTKGKMALTHETLKVLAFFFPQLNQNRVNDITFKLQKMTEE